MILAAALLPAITASAQAPAPPAAEITGGVDESGQWFRWTVRNGTMQPITRIDFPQFGGDAMDVPPGWGYEWPAGGSGTGEPVTVTPRTGASGLRPGGTAEFALRVPRGGAQTGRGAALVHFADGTTASIPGVETARAPSFGERYSTMIGFAVVFAIILAVGLRQRRAIAPDDDDKQTDST